MLPTIIIASIIAMILVLIVAGEIRKKKQGRSSCSCGGNCSACGVCPHKHQEEKK